MPDIPYLPFQTSADLQTRSGARLLVRPAELHDAKVVTGYFAGLSQQSRYSRFMGAMSGLSAVELDHSLRSTDGRYPLLAIVKRDDGREIVVGEARCVVDEAGRQCEVAMSICDKVHQRGFGAALLGNLFDRAVIAGIDLVFGDTLRSNDGMIATARKLGFAFEPVTGDWKQVRFSKMARAQDRALDASFDTTGARRAGEAIRP